MTYYMAILQDLIWLTNFILLMYIVEPISLNIVFSTLQASFSSSNVSAFNTKSSAESIFQGQSILNSLDKASITVFF